MFRKKWDFWPAWLWACFQMHWVCNNAFHWPYHPWSILNVKSGAESREWQNWHDLDILLLPAPLCILGKWQIPNFVDMRSLWTKYFFPVRTGCLNRILQFWPSRKNMYFCTTSKEKYFHLCPTNKIFLHAMPRKISVHLWPRKTDGFSGQKFYTAGFTEI